MIRVKVHDKIFKVLFLLLLISSCKEEKKDLEMNINLETMLEKTLKSQLEGGNSREYQIYEYSESDLQVTLPILKKELKNNGYKFIKSEDFNKIIKSVFGRTIDTNSISKYLHVNYFDKCDKQIFWRLNDNIDYKGFFIVKKENFISELFALPQLIDYKKTYPEIAKVEQNTLEIYNNTENESMQLHQWKDDEDLTGNRLDNIQKLVNRNKYLFNDSHASFTWLKINDSIFLENLVKTFGYYEDKDLLKFVLDKSLSDNEEFGKVIWNKDCQDKLLFNEEIFSIINSLPEDEQKPYFDRISHYLEYLLVDGLNQKMAEIGLTFSQKTEMLAKLAYYATKATGTEGAYYYSFFNFLNSEEFINEFEKQNYYNLKDFKSLFEETKSGGVGLPM